jgi:hypothetical protein
MCTGDVDACGARRFPEAWAWVRSLLSALREGRPIREAARAADRHLRALEDDGAFGRARPRTVTIHYPGFGKPLQMTIRN